MAQRYVCNHFLTNEGDDSKRFNMVFGVHLSYIKKINIEIKEWVAANIERWKQEQPDLFNVEAISDEFLPNDVFEAEGGSNRRRCSVRLR